MRSPINEHFRATGRSTMGVKFVTPKDGDAVAVVARSVEAKEDEASMSRSRRRRGGRRGGHGRGTVAESPDADADATIDGSGTTPTDRRDPEESEA